MIVKRAHHNSFSVRNLERSDAFYAGLLGLPTIERPDFGIPGTWYQAGDVQLHLIQLPEGAEAGLPSATLTPLANHLAFEIDDYEATSAMLKEHGHELIEFGSELGQMFLKDPDGNIIELIQPGGQLGRR